MGENDDTENIFQVLICIINALLKQQFFSYFFVTLLFICDKEKPGSTTGLASASFNYINSIVGSGVIGKLIFN